MRLDLRPDCQRSVSCSLVQYRSVASSGHSTDNEVGRVIEFARLDTKDWQMAAFVPAAAILWRAEQVSQVKRCHGKDVMEIF